MYQICADIDYDDLILGEATSQLPSAISSSNTALDQHSTDYSSSYYSGTLYLNIKGQGDSDSNKVIRESLDQHQQHSTDYSSLLYDSNPYLDVRGNSNSNDGKVIHESLKTDEYNVDDEQVWIHDLKDTYKPRDLVEVGWGHNYEKT